MSCYRKLLSKIRGGRVLDAACGTGRMTGILAESLDGFISITGIDPDKASIDAVRDQTDDRRISFRLMDVMDLAPSPERFNTCSIAYAIHHLEDPQAVLTRLVTVMVPGGTLIVNEPVNDGLSPAQETARDFHHLKAAIDRLRGRVHNDTLSSRSILDMIDGLDLDGVRVCSEKPPDKPPEDDEPEKHRAFLEDYLRFAEGRPEYEALARRRDDLFDRMKRYGFESPTHLVISGTKPA